MRLIQGTVYTKAICEPNEVLALRAVLSTGSDDEYREFVEIKGNEGLFYSGLIPYVMEKWGMLAPGTVQLEVEPEAEAPFIPINEILIPPDLMPKLVEAGKPLRDYQRMCIRKAVYKRRGIAAIATGGGKTITGAGFIWYLQERGLVNRAMFLVDGRHLLKQAYADFQEAGFEGLSRLGAGYKDATGQVVIATVDSIYEGIKRNDPVILKLLEEAGAVVFDEVAHLRSETWMAVGERIKAKYRLGLDAAPFDLMQQNEDYNPDYFPLVGLTGPLLVRLPAYWLWRRGYIAEPFLTMVRVGGENINRLKDWQAVYRWGILDNPVLNQTVVGIAAWLYGREMHTLILTQIKEHAVRLIKMLSDAGIPAVNMIGGEQCRFFDGSKLRQETWSIQQYREYIESRPASVTVATQVFDQGINIPTMHAMIPCGGIRKYRPVVQRLGRVMRAKKGPLGNFCYVFDIYHENHFWLTAQSKKRLKIYEAEKIDVHWDYQDVVNAIENPGQGEPT